jgi:hypothetical protein
MIVIQFLLASALGIGGAVLMVVLLSWMVDGVRPFASYGERKDPALAVIGEIAAINGWFMEGRYLKHTATGVEIALDYDYEKIRGVDIPGYAIELTKGDKKWLYRRVKHLIVRPDKAGDAAKLLRSKMTDV